MEYRECILLWINHAWNIGNVYFYELIMHGVYGMYTFKTSCMEYRECILLWINHAWNIGNVYFYELIMHGI